MSETTTVRAICGELSTSDERRRHARVDALTSLFQRCQNDPDHSIPAMGETLVRLCHAEAAGVALAPSRRRDASDTSILDDDTAATISERLGAEPGIVRWYSGRDGQYYAATSLARCQDGFVWARRARRFDRGQLMPLRWVGRFASMILAFRRRQDQVDLLLDESRHRSANDLQLVTSLLNAQARQYRAGSAAHQALSTASDCIHSLAVTRRVGDAALADMLRSFADGLSAQVAHRGIAIDIVSTIPPDLALSKQRRSLLMIAVNECVTNAIKHGFADGDQGAVHVRLRDDTTRLIVEIEDDGMPMNHAAGPRAKSGLDLIGRILAGARGRLSLPPEGSKLFRIELPIR